MKKLIILLIIAMLFIAACDILNHDLYHNGDLENFFKDFTTAFDNIEDGNLEAVMIFYDDEYSNDLTVKDEIEQFYNSLFTLHEGSVRFYPELVSYNKFEELKWELIVTWETNDSTDSETFIFEDMYNETVDGFMFIGNQIDPPALDPTKPVVFVEYGTGENCGNCPPIGAKLNSMKKEYGGQFIYVEYCQNEPSTPTHHFMDFAIYYSAFTQPYIVMQGIHHNEGGTQDNVELVESQYLDVLAGNPEAFITDIIWNEESAGTIAGSVNLDIGSVSTEDLKLRIFILNEHPDLHYHADDSALHNVVFATQEINISASGSVNYSLEYLQDDYPELPEKARLVFALQTKTETYNPDTCIVYTAAEKKLYED